MLLEQFKCPRLKKKASRTLSLALILLAPGFAAAEAITKIVDQLNFDSNQLPSGWGFSNLNWGQNYGIRDGRFYVGEIDTTTLLYRSVDLARASKVTVEWDGNVSAVYWGQSTASMVTGNTQAPWSNYLSGALWKNGFGQDAMSIAIGGAGPGRPAANQYQQTYAPNYGAYHVTTTYSDGQASIIATNKLSGQTYQSGTVLVPGFKLSDMTGVGLLAGTTTGEAAWVDNISISATFQQPRTFGLFVGVNDSISLPAIRADIDADKLSRAFYNLSTSYRADTLTKSFGSLSNTNNTAIAPKEIADAISKLTVDSHRGDTLVVYVSSHGAEIIDKAALQLGTSDSANTGFVYGSDIVDFFKAEDGSWEQRYDGINKLFIIDACYSGGFWNQLKDIPNSALIAAAGPGKESAYSVANGESLMQKAIALGWSPNPATGNLWADINLDGSISVSELKSFIDLYLLGRLEFTLPVAYGSTLYLKGRGDPVVFTPDLMMSTYVAGEDFVINSISAVPEPSSIILLLAGLVIVIFAVKRTTPEAFAAKH